MACGKAVISSGSGGAAEIVSDGETALVHAPGDAAGLAKRIACLIADPELRARLAHAGRLAAVRRFDRTLVTNKLIPIYRELIFAAA